MKKLLKAMVLGMFFVTLVSVNTWADSKNDKECKEITEKTIFDYAVRKEYVRPESTYIFVPDKKYGDLTTRISLESQNYTLLCRNEIGNEIEETIVEFLYSDDNYDSLYNAVYNAIGTSTVFSLEDVVNIDQLMGFNVIVNYTYYSPYNNQYNYPYYRHGMVRILTHENYNANTVGDIYVMYLSRGLITNVNGSGTYGFNQSESTLIWHPTGPGLMKSKYSSDNNDNPYYWVQSSTVENGIACSGVKVSFRYAKYGLVNTRVLYHYFLYDQTAPEFDMFWDNEFIWP